MKIKNSTKENKKTMLMTSQAEKSLVYLPQVQGYEDVNPEEMGGRGRGGRHSFIFCSFRKKIDTFFILIWITRSRGENSVTCQHHNEVYFPWNRIQNKLDTASISIPQIKRNSLEDGLTQEVKTRLNPKNNFICSMIRWGDWVKPVFPILGWFYPPEDIGSVWSHFCLSQLGEGVILASRK